MPKPTTPEDYVYACKSAMSAAIRELASAMVFADRAGAEIPAWIRESVTTLHDQARCVRSNMDPQEAPRG